MVLYNSVYSVRLFANVYDCFILQKHIYSQAFLRWYSGGVTCDNAVLPNVHKPDQNSENNIVCFDLADVGASKGRTVMALAHVVFVCISSLT